MKVVNIHKTRAEVYGGRPSMFGNPFEVTPERPRDVAIQLFRLYFYERIKDPVFRSYVLGLKGKTVGCFCKPKDCHLDIVADWVNRQSDSESETRSADL